MKLLNFNLRCNDDPNGHSIGERGFRIIDIIYDQSGVYRNVVAQGPL